MITYLNSSTPKPPLSTHTVALNHHLLSIITYLKSSTPKPPLSTQAPYAYSSQSVPLSAAAQTMTARAYTCQSVHLSAVAQPMAQQQMENVDAILKYVNPNR